jgi:predicted methyltransferase
MGILPSPEAVERRAAAPRIKFFACDSSDLDTAPHFQGVDATHLLIMFTLSALSPSQQLNMLKNAFRALRPGGMLLLRDHGLYDMVQVEITIMASWFV